MGIKVLKRKLKNHVEPSKWNKLINDENTFLIDEFLADLHARNKLSLQFNKKDKNILLHGHCHQKALASQVPTKRMLELPKAYKVRMIPSGCCGMAGSFGYEKEHYDLSMKIGEEALFPTIRAKEDDWEITVMGVSCRQQVEDGTGRKARHLAEVLADALE